MQTSQGMPGQSNPQWQQNMNMSNQQMTSGLMPGMDVNMVGQGAGVGVGGDDLGLSTAPLSYNQKTSERMRHDESESLFDISLLFS